MAFHEGLGMTVLAGTPLGFQSFCCASSPRSEITETWLFGGTSLPSVSPFGAGCSGIGDGPSLQPGSGSLPFVGSTFRVQLQGLPGEAASFVLLGASNTVWGGRSLPFALGAIGMPNCSFVVSPDLVVPIGPGGTSAFLDVPVPLDPSLVGEIVYLQGGVIDPAANPAGVALTGGLAATLGGR